MKALEARLPYSLYCFFFHVFSFKLAYGIVELISAMILPLYSGYIVALYSIL